MQERCKIGVVIGNANVFYECEQSLYSAAVST